MDLEQILTASIESALNRFISLDPDALSRFALLEGKIIAIEITGLNKTLALFPCADGFMVLSDFDGDADATIIGSLIALAKMGLTDNPKPLLFSGEISIKGNTRIANQFNRLLSQLDIDWEEQVAKNVGDILAHKMGNALHSAQQWVKRSTQSVCLDTGEYLQEEIHLSPANAELNAFINQVDELREATDRLSARIDHLTKN